MALEVDELERVRVDRLPDALARARAAGRRPMALVAAACATSTGLHDDLRGIGEFCREHGIWLHVDGAHGASALCRSGCEGCSTGSSSPTPSCGTRTRCCARPRSARPCSCAAASDLPAAFRQHASYLDFDNPHGVDAIDRQVECTKSELGLKLFLASRSAASAAWPPTSRSSTRRRWRSGSCCASGPGFDVPYRPESNILCFRFGPAGAAQAAIREALLAAGEFHLSSAEIAGERFLRVTVMSPASDARTFARLLDAIEAAPPAARRPSSRPRARAPPAARRRRRCRARA